jgi:hypothetical protein
MAFLAIKADAVQLIAAVASKDTDAQEVIKSRHDPAELLSAVVLVSATLAGDGVQKKAVVDYLRFLDGSLPEPSNGRKKAA